jgi:hypothetical protein
MWVHCLPARLTYLPRVVATCRISDRNKLLLLRNPDIWVHLKLGLFADLERHPRGPDAPSPTIQTGREMMEIWQCHYAETLHQLALFSIACDALREQASVLQALEEVAERGMTSNARQHAQRALMALSNVEPEQRGGAPKHIMLSYQWDSQVSHNSYARSLMPDRCCKFAYIRIMRHCCWLCSPQ